MKTLSRILALCLVAVLCLCFSVTASASDLSKFSSLLNRAEYSSTQAFMDAMDEAEISYDYLGLDEDEDEWLGINYYGSYEQDIIVKVFFQPEGDRASFRCWNMIDYDGSDFTDILVVLNQLNYEYKWVKFVADTTDDSVTVEKDVLFTADDAGWICLETLDQIVSIADDSYELLQSFAK